MLTLGLNEGNATFTQEHEVEHDKMSLRKRGPDNAETGKFSYFCYQFKKILQEHLNFTAAVLLGFSTGCYQDGEKI